MVCEVELHARLYPEHAVTGLAMALLVCVVTHITWWPAYSTHAHLYLKRFEMLYTQSMEMSAFYNLCVIHTKQGSMKVCGHILLGVAIALLHDDSNITVHRSNCSFT